MWSRFCYLLHEIPARPPRFLIITHNPITMARINWRLFGVLMAARGVPLVSVATWKRG